MTKFIIAPHMRLQEWVAEEKGYFAAEGLDYEFRDELISAGRQAARPRRQDRRLSDLREGADERHQLRLPLDGQCRGVEWSRQALC
jgi:hypothetical protein